ncbi:chemotaxis protein CheW [Sulfuriferula sp. AH1]|uniref:chemotaxis protein CheW n=1 Tax=Sulfuriferula sp. AH1 TaxID=1985873 RepID=UPI000B3B1E41|nr:chemotaxis protein CheW [Sulfuriferula sp. AH1]ARU31227.1 chemotaxis protein CheW [Sulfuriferula sp. AH1]
MTNATTHQNDMFLPYMRDVVRSEQSLRELNLMWRMIESSAKMNYLAETKSILQTMAATRAGFDQLEQELVSSLVHEKIANVLMEIGTKAHYVIDIVVRNLYERTADVGFLATDRDLCEFVAGVHDDPDSIRARLLAYRNKYTVYDEIMLLDKDGNLLIQINEHSEVEGSIDPLIAQTLASETYVETFRAVDLRPCKEKSLIYSQRMLHPETGEVIGILCLCFDFEKEMRGIFDSHRDPEERANMLLLDSENRVIASADTLWMPLGAVVPVNRSGSTRLMMFGGRKYLVQTFVAEGYQGYMGPPGWQGQVMVPVEVAFMESGSSTLTSLDPVIADGLLSHAQTFSPPLYKIMQAAETIQRVVWNGQVMTAGHGSNLLQLKSVLEQISETGNRSNELFSQSISNLYETVLGSSLRGTEFMSHLLVDLLDRNLYERSNDCRWWALTPALRNALATPVQTDAMLKNITGILAYINSLYTVYTRIFVYDKSGRIIASTNLAHKGEDGAAIGTAIDHGTLQAVLSLATEQDYYVTPFTATPLYDNLPTYIYHAAIRHPDNPNTIVGGIGIVFDAAPEFSAMLHGGLNGKADTSAFFVNREGYIIASTDPDRPVGTLLDLDSDILHQKNGRSSSGITIHDDHYASMGCTVSSGYREFKATDGYKDDIIAVVFESFGEVRERNLSCNKAASVLDSNSVEAGGKQFATFFIDGNLFAIPAELVLEALPGSAILPMSMGGFEGRVGMLAVEHENEAKQFIWVFDLGYMVRGKSSEITAGCQVIVVQHDQQSIGLLVDELHGVPEFGDEQITPTPFAKNGNGTLVPQVIQANHGNLLIQVLDIDYIYRTLNTGEMPTMPEMMIQEAA